MLNLREDIDSVMSKSWEILDILFPFCSGEPSLHDIQLIDKECFKPPEQLTELGVQVATYANRERDAVNTAAFEEYCDSNAPDRGMFNGALIVLMDDLRARDSKKHFSYYLIQLSRETFGNTVERMTVKRGEGMEE